MRLAAINSRLALVFTGTPAGIGWARDPKVTLRPGDRLVTHAEVIGEMTTTFTAA